MLRFFAWLHRVSGWFRRRLSAGGRLVAATAAIAAALGVDTRASMAHAVFAAAAMLLLVGFVARGRLHRVAAALAVETRLPDFVTAGSPAHCNVRVRNRSARRLPALALALRVRQPMPRAADFARRQSAADNWFDRRVGYPDFIDWLRRLRCIDAGDIVIPPLLPGQAVELSLGIEAVQRGVAVVDGLTLSRGDPLGLWCSLAEITAAATLVVLPRTWPVLWPEGGGSRHHQPGGIARASRVGDSEEFRALRDYRPGDPLRAIHWRSWARTGRPVVREQQDEYFARHALILDTATTQPFSPDFEAAVAVAASFAVARRGVDSLLDLLFVAAATHCITVGRGLGTAETMLRVLAAVQPSPPARFAELARTVLLHAAAMSSAVVVLQGWDAARAELVGALQARRIALRVFVAGGVGDDAPPLPEALRRIRADAVAEALA